MSNIRLFYSKSLSLNLTDKLDKSQAKILNISKNIVEFNVRKQLRKKENIKEIWLAFLTH